MWKVQKGIGKSNESQVMSAWNFLVSEELQVDVRGTETRAAQGVHVNDSSTGCEYESDLSSRDSSGPQASGKKIEKTRFYPTRISKEFPDWLK
jgi:hypothetical protein